MTTIRSIEPLEILDSRGNPTIQVEITLHDGTCAIASVPSGASTGQFEAYELRDEDKRYHGKGVQKALNYIREVIAPELIDFDVTEQRQLDSLLCELDGTKNKSRLGANSLLAVSLAACRVAANSLDQPLHQYLSSLMTGSTPSLPIPMMNVINGGVHADNGLSIQEFMIVPHRFDTIQESIRAGAEVFHTLKKLLHEKGLNTAVGDEGGFAPNIRSHEAVLDFLLLAIEKAGYIPGEEIALTLDVAATEFFESGNYHLLSERLNANALSDYYMKLIDAYPIVSIEDPFAEEDWRAWQAFNKNVGQRIQIVGDDLFVTNVARLQRGIQNNAANAILIKPNQIGTLTETIEAIEMAQAAKMGVVISHRSGETEDPFIADLAVASGAGQLKTGSLSRTDRIVKYNRLLSIAAKSQLDLAKRQR